MTAWHRLIAEYGWRWGRTIDGDRFEAWVGAELRNMDRLMVGLHWWDQDVLALDVTWGYPGSDPIWSFGLAVRLPDPVADWLGRHHVGS